MRPRRAAARRRFRAAEIRLVVYEEMDVFLELLEMEGVLTAAQLKRAQDLIGRARRGEERVVREAA